MFWKRKSWEDDYDDSYGSRPARKALDRPILWIHIVFLITLAVLALGAIWSINGRTMLERSLKGLASPLGLVWLLLIVQIYFAAVYRAAAAFWCGLSVWIVMSVGGNYFVTRALSQSAERPYLEIDPFSGEAYDLLVVLGGGTESKPGGHPQLCRSGERVALAAELYHAGLVKQIVATGTAAFATTEKDQQPCEEAKQILTELAVPQDSIVMLRGNNTSEEAQSVSQWLLQMSEEQRPRRIGLVTSAWHLNRALGLFRQAGVTVEPVPADFFSAPFAPHPSMVIPSAQNLGDTTILLHEFLGRWIGR